jgi:hypothetical protein
MILVGKNYAGYGEFLDENFIHLLENGANNTAPGAPLTGQLWWDKTNGLLKVYNGTIFKNISADALIICFCLKIFQIFKHLNV